MAMMTETRTHPYPEGKIAAIIERQTAEKLPSDWFLWTAGASIAASLWLKLRKRDQEAVFIGHWVPTLLILGLYNKLVKLHGSH